MNKYLSTQLCVTELQSGRRGYDWMKHGTISSSSSSSSFY